MGGFLTGVRFPLVYDEYKKINIVFTNTLVVKKAKMNTFKKIKYTQDELEEMKAKERLRLRNFPIIFLTGNGDIRVSSLSSLGAMK